jgi:hypothetical protein
MKKSMDFCFKLYDSSSKVITEPSLNTSIDESLLSSQRMRG